MYELRYYLNPRQYEVVGTYGNPQLAYGMRKKKNKESPTTYSLASLRVVKV